MRRFILLLIATINSFSLLAQEIKLETNNRLISTLQAELITNSAYGSFQGLPIEKIEGSFNELRIYSDHPFSIFIEDEIVTTVDDEAYILGPSDTLIWSNLKRLKLFPNKADQIILVDVFKIEKTKVDKFRLDNEDHFYHSTVFNNVFIGLALFIFVVLVALKVGFPKRFYEIFSLRRTFSIRSIESDNTRLRLFDQDGLLVALLYILMTSFILWLYFYSEDLVKSGSSTNEALLSYLRILLIFTFILAFKIVLVSLMSFLYKLSKISVFYLKQLANISILFVLLIFTMSLIAFLTRGSLPENWSVTIKYGVIILYIVRTVFLYFKILKLSGFTNLYLFSYFCSTEILPLIIGVKLFY